MNILITGASSGIGKALAEFYGTAGNTIFISARREERLEEITANLSKNNLKCYYKKCDVADKAEVESMISTAKQKNGKYRPGDFECRDGYNIEIC